MGDEGLKDADASPDDVLVVDLTEEGPVPTMVTNTEESRKTLAEVRRRLDKLQEGVPIETTVSDSTSFDPAAFIVDITDGDVHLAGDSYAEALAVTAGGVEASDVND